MVNKKFYELDNLEYLKSRRQQVSRTVLAAEIGCKAGSIAWKERLFSKEVRDSFVYERLHRKEDKDAC